jgi:hypothetical protein
MNIATWVLQGLAAALFLLLGSLHLFAPIEKLVARNPSLASLSPRLVRFIGVCEIVGAIGLIAPAATGSLPWLTPIAACCLAALMVCAAVFHVAHLEYAHIIRPAVVFAITLIIVFARWRLAVA